MPAIYHITHLDNLSLILRDGYLWCDAERNLRAIESVGIAHANIKRRRANRVVPTCRRGVLADYVPFYFAPRSPMLCAIHNGKVEGYAGGQPRVIHLVSSVERVIESQRPYTFTNGHAEMEVTSFYEDPKDLDNVDWAVMQSRMWSDTLKDSNRKWRRQAEFLVHHSFPVSLFDAIGVFSQEIANITGEVLASEGYDFAPQVRRNWYY